MLTLSSIQPHKVPLSIRVSLLRRVLSKTSHQISSTYIPPPFLSYLSEFSIVFHQNYTVGKLTFSSIQRFKRHYPLGHLRFWDWYTDETFSKIAAIWRSGCVCPQYLRIYVFIVNDALKFYSLDMRLKV